MSSRKNRRRKNQNIRNTKNNKRKKAGWLLKLNHKLTDVLVIAAGDVGAHWFINEAWPHINQALAQATNLLHMCRFNAEALTNEEKNRQENIVENLYGMRLAIILAFGRLSSEQRNQLRANKDELLHAFISRYVWHSTECTADDLTAFFNAFSAREAIKKALQ